MSAIDYDAADRAAFRARIMAAAMANAPPTIRVVRDRIADALYDYVPMGVECVVTVLKPVQHGVDAILIELVNERGEPIRPSWRYRFRKLLRNWWLS